MLLEYYIGISALIGILQFVNWFNGSKSLEDAIAVSLLWPLYVLKALVKSIISLVREW
jgi:hypothetical protein